MTVEGAKWSEIFSAASTEAMRAYEEIFVPRLFGPFGELLADVAEIATGEAVLDVACGPGSVSRIASARVGSSGRVTGADISPAMLEIARSKGTVENGAPIEYVESSAAPLAVPSNVFDVVVCQQGLQFFPDRAASIEEMLRALRSGGRVAIAVWTPIADSPPFASLAHAIDVVLGPELGAKYRGGPWGLTDPDVLKSLAEEAGFDEVSVARHELPYILEGGPAQKVQTLASSPIAPEFGAMSEADTQRLIDALAADIVDAIDADGAIRSFATTFIVTGRKP